MNQRLIITPVTPVIGASVSGVNLSHQLDESVFDEIKAALDKHLVLVFNDQNLDAQVLRNVTERFGPIYCHHKDEGVIFSEGVPEVVEMVKEADGHRLFGGSDWHADVTFESPEGYVSILHAKTIPPLGGDTAFANTICAFEALSPGMKKMLRGLSAVHSYDGRGRPDNPKHTATHKVVRRHLQTGQDGLYINRMFATRFEGMTSAESEPIIDYLDRHMSRLEFTCRISWQPGQLLIWDNRFTLHYPINDFTGHRRRLIRSTALVSDAHQTC